MNLRSRIDRRFPAITAHHAPFGCLTTMGVGGIAELLFKPNSTSQAAALARFLKQAGVPGFYLGGGSNSVCRDEGYNGAVISMRGLSKFHFHRDRLVAEAGTSLARLVHCAARNEASGFECLAGIPGTVGGAAYMNAGGRAGDISERVISLLVLDPQTGVIHRMPRAAIPYTYRRSNLGGRLILEVELSTTRAPAEQIAARTQAIMKAKRTSQPLRARSAGCMFKNPPGQAAARLIDQAGLKGTRVGRAQVSSCHANFICAEKGAAAADVWQLVEKVRQTVEEQYGVWLDLEVQEPVLCSI